MLARNWQIFPDYKGPQKDIFIVWSGQISNFQVFDFQGRQSINFLSLFRFVIA